jgi:hypothetical protein
MPEAEEMQQAAASHQHSALSIQPERVWGNEKAAMPAMFESAHIRAAERSLPLC